MKMIRATGKRIIQLLTFVIFTFLFTTTIYSQQFKFAWLSDTHVGGTTGAEDLIISVRDINTFHDIDFVILSGDVTETGKTTDLQRTKIIGLLLSVILERVESSHRKSSDEKCPSPIRIIGPSCIPIKQIPL